MPFLNYDLKDFEPYKNLICPDSLIIPTSDDIAWEHFDKWRWVYNKLDLALVQNIIAAPVGIEPREYPVFQKPIYNLWGGAAEAYLVENKTELKRHPGLFWQELAVGRHFSIDCIIQNGNPVYFVTFEGIGKGAGLFDYWKLCKLPKEQKIYLQKFIKKYFSGYSGCLNVEMIGLKIIEAHLRMGDIDKLYDLDLMQNIVNVYLGKKFNFNYEYDFGLFLFPVWIRPSDKYNLSEDKIIDCLAEASFYQIDDERFYDLNSPGYCRYLIFGINSFSRGKTIRSDIYRYLNQNKIQY